MSRVKRGINTHRRHASLLERAKGFRTGRRKLFKRASEAVLQAGQFAYRDRRTKKRDLRRAWIVRINAAVRAQGMTYSAFIAALKESGSELNRKIMSDMAIQEPAALDALIKQMAAKQK